MIHFYLLYDTSYDTYLKLFSPDFSMILSYKMYYCMIDFDIDNQCYYDTYDF